MKAKTTTKEPFKMNLQLFADTQPSQADLTAQAMSILQGGGQQAQQAPMDMGNMQMGQPDMSMGDNPQNSPQNSENSGQVAGQEPNQPMQGTEQPSQQAPSNANELILGKFKSPEELANAYANLEQFNTKTRQELAQQAQTTQELQAALEQLKQQMGNNVQPQVQQQQQPQMTPEEMNEQMMNKFYENPSEFFNQIKEQAKQELMQQIAPMQQQFQAQQRQAAWNQAVGDFAQAHPDMQTLQPVMSQIFNENPELNNHPNGPQAALNIAYMMAKGQQYRDPNSLLQDQNFVKQNILGNQDIKNQIIQEYLQGLKQGNQAPTVISGQVNGATPIVPENKPQTMEEARNLAMKIMQNS